MTAAGSRRSHLVTVIMPVFNTTCIPLLYAIQSLEKQLISQLDFELIVVDDGSSDPDTLNCFKQLEATAKTKSGFPIEVVHLDQNRGAGAARNVAAIMSRSKYLAFLDSDDALMSQSLLLRTRTADRGSLDMVWTSFLYRQMTAMAGTFKTSPVRVDLCCTTNTLGFQTKDEAYSAVLDHNIAANMTVLIKRETFLRLGGFEESLVCSEDWVLWRRVLEDADTKVEFINEPTAFYQSWFNGKHQSQVLHTHAHGRHLDVKHPAGKAGQYLDGEAITRSDQWRFLWKPQS